MNITALCRSLDTLLGEMHGLHPLLHGKISYCTRNLPEFVASRVVLLEDGKYRGYTLTFAFIENGKDVGSLRFEIFHHASAQVYFTETSIADNVPAVSRQLKRVFSESEVPLLSINKVTLLSRVPGRFLREKEVGVELSPTAKIINVVNEILPVFDRAARILLARQTLEISMR